MTTVHELPVALRLEDELVACFTAMGRALSDLFDRIVDLDHAEAYRTDGARTMSDWLSYRLGISQVLAREWVAAAHALDVLPAIRHALRHGLLGWDKVRWLVRFVTFEEDPAWAADAAGMSAEEVRTAAQRRIEIARATADSRFARRYLRVARDSEQGVVRIWGRLADTDGQTVLAAIDRRAKVAPPEVAFEQRRADALVEVCSMALGADPSPDRATVVAHVDLQDLLDGRGNGMLEGGMAVASDTVRRLACDGRLQIAAHPSGGDPAASRTTRTVPAALHRQLRLRDGSCTFPGCSNHLWVHAHHVVHFADGGPTTLDNLVLLCGFHHRLVHEGGWDVRRSPEGGFTFMRPDGSPMWVRPVARAP